jgi:hypothetical protein
MTQAERDLQDVIADLLISVFTILNNPAAVEVIEAARQRVIAERRVADVNGRIVVGPDRMQ